MAPTALVLERGATALTLTRRGALGTALAFAACRRAGAAAASLPPRNALAFQVCRNGSTIGTHRLDFTQSAGALTVNIDAAFRVGLGFITFYRYHHRGVEQWRDGRFQSLDTETDDNGRQFRVRAQRVGAGILIQATDLRDQIVPAEALPLTHWAVAAMSAPLFNPQTGKLLRETVKPQGRAMVTLADGSPIEATGYALAGEAPIHDWYDKRQVWAALDARGADGSAITYRRM
jgi:hypothetical protein